MHSNFTPQGCLGGGGGSLLAKEKKKKSSLISESSIFYHIHLKVMENEQEQQHRSSFAGCLKKCLLICWCTNQPQNNI